MASERDLGPLIGFAVRERQGHAEERVREWSQDDWFFVRLLRANLVVSHGNTVGEATVRRTVVLNWPALAKLLTQPFAAQRIEQIDPTLLQEEFGDDAALLRHQTSEFARDPSAGERAMRRFHVGDDEEEEEEEAQT